MINMFEVTPPVYRLVSYARNGFIGYYSVGLRADEALAAELERLSHSVFAAQYGPLKPLTGCAMENYLVVNKTKQLL